MELKHGKICRIVYAGVLLIVPYGIETRLINFARYMQPDLLIVPYGIETILRAPRVSDRFTFNRTLWN